MLGYLGRRLVYIVIILLVMSALIFWITQIMPGNVAYMIAGELATPDQIAVIERQLGLNDPGYVQYWRWLSGVLSGDLGRSMLMARPITPIVLDALMHSAILAGISMALVTIIGIWLGVFSAIRHGNFSDQALSVSTYFFISVPEFFWSILMILIFAGYLGWLPASGYTPMSDGLGAWAKHLILPVFTLTSGLVAHVSRLTRSSMLETMQSQYITAARAKGISERRVVWHHALRNALLPTITILAVNVGFLMGGIVVVETVFSYPGLGRLLIFSIEQKDIPFIQAGILVVTAVYAVSNLIADVLYTLFNPKVRYGNTFGD
jgi:peptide/nickel transport system permease protein